MRKIISFFLAIIIPVCGMDLLAQSNHPVQDDPIYSEPDKTGKDNKKDNNPSITQEIVKDNKKDDKKDNKKDDKKDNKKDDKKDNKKDEKKDNNGPSVSKEFNNANAEHIIYVDVPKKLNIKDKIILVNRTSTTIVQAVVVLVNGDSYKTLGNASLVSPGSDFEVASYSGNWLKNLKGQKIGVKIKGVKKAIANDLNNIDPELVTYDYDVTVSEKNHDLYIIVTTGRGAVFDF